MEAQIQVDTKIVDESVDSSMPYCFESRAISTLDVCDPVGSNQPKNTWIWPLKFLD